MTDDLVSPEFAERVASRIKEQERPPREPAPGFDDRVSARLKSRAAATLALADGGDAEPAVDVPKNVTLPATATPVPPVAPPDPVQSALTEMAAMVKAFTMVMSAPRVIIRDEQGRIVRSEVQHSKDGK